VALSLIGASLYALPYPLKMEATGKVLPVVRRVIFTPQPGTIKRFEVAPGEQVTENRVLALMYDANLYEKYHKLMAEMKAAETEATALEQQLERETLPSEKASLRSKAALRRADQESKRLELRELVRRTNAQSDRTGFFSVQSPPMSSEERRLVGSNAPWTVLTGDFKSELQDKEVKPSEPIMRLGVKEGPWEIELKIPQKHIGQILRAYNRLNTDELEVDFLLSSETTVMYKGFLNRDRIASEATPKTDDQNDNEPYVLAFVRIEGQDIPEGYRVDRKRLTSATDVRAKVRCGPERAGYSLFYGVWEFLY
jgi:hypothetical protein